MLVVLLLLLVVSFDNSSNFVLSTINRCQPIPSNFSLCYGLGYTQMYLPNLFNHESITEILYELPLWESLLSLKCHPNARLLLCSILAPVCFQQKQEKQNMIVSFDNNNQNSISRITHNNPKFLFPCRTLCESVKQTCEPRMINQFGYKWPSMIDCNQYPKETELCISHLLSTTTLASPPITISKFDLCSMCQSELNISDLLNDYCQSSIVIRTRPIKMSSTSKHSLIFANKHKVRYFKGKFSNKTMKNKFEFVLEKCSCMKFHSPIILFISPTGKLIRFISIEQNPNALQKFRYTIILRKPRCQHQLST